MSDFNNVDDELQARAEAAEQQAEIDRGHELRRIIDFGFAVEHFKNGEIGQRILADAIAERDLLVNRYIILDPDDSGERKEMRAIQLRIGVINVLWEFVEHYIRDGEAAQAQYRAAEQVD